jgi:hypothetical protein
MLPSLNFIRAFPVNLLMVYLLAGYLLVGTALLDVSQISFADEVYLRDILYMPLREGESTKHRIIHRGIRSGAPLERIEINDAKEILTREQGNLADQNARLVEDLATITTLSGNVIAIDEQNKQLSEERDALLQQINDLNELTDALSDDRAQQWFLRGSGVVLAGLLLGFLLGRRIYHRRYHGGWL